MFRLDKLGDLVLNSPFLRELRANLPEAHITLVVHPDAYPLVELCPYVDQTLTYDYGEHRIGPDPDQLRRIIRFCRSHFESRPPDTALLPRWDADWYGAPFLGYFCGARRRYGYSEAVSPDKAEFNQGYDSLFTDLLDDAPPRHEVERNLALLGRMGLEVSSDHLELWLSEKDRQWADDMLGSQAGYAYNRFFALAPGAGLASRCWPAERYGQLAKWLWQRFELPTVIVGGGPQDAALGRELADSAGSPLLNLAGQASLRQSAALISRARLFIGNDSAPAHLAAAARRPVIMISRHPVGGDPNHFNSPVRFGPWKTPSVVVQPDAAFGGLVSSAEDDPLAAINSISLGQVQEAVLRLYGGGLG